MNERTSAEKAAACWRSECRSGCYYPDVCSERPTVEKDAHAPTKAYSVSEFPDWVFIRCACGENPIAGIWLRHHWTGDPEAGKAAVHDLIAAQAEAEARDFPPANTPDGTR